MPIESSDGPTTAEKLAALVKAGEKLERLVRGPIEPSEGPSPEEQERRTRKFTKVLPIIRQVAREHGYAIGEHGSRLRDLDLIAAPWVDEVSAPETLAEAVRRAVDGHIRNNPEADPHDYTQRNPQPKPHGRLGWSIQLGRGAYVDLSVLPTTAEAKRSAHLEDARAGWKVAEGNAPPPVGDCRKLVWLVEKDGMAWIGIRAYNHATGEWWINAVNGGNRESAVVTHWMDLPERPEVWDAISLPPGGKK